MTRSSRFPGFYRLSVRERHEKLAEGSGVTVEELGQALQQGGLDLETADKVVENVIGTYGLPFGVALNVRINGQDRIAPMVVEEPSVIAAASNAARRIRDSGGFRAEMVEDLMTTQVQIFNVPDPKLAKERILAAETELLGLGTEAVPGLVARGGGPRELSVHDLGHGCLVVHVHVDCQDAMGANLVNQIAEALGPRVASLASGELGLRILTNLSDRRRVRVTCRVHHNDLALDRGSSDSVAGTEVACGIEQASRFAELDPYRAATHNKGIMNGVDAVVLATGNDFRAVEAGAHAYAAITGTYRPLATWRVQGEELLGELEMPLALGTVGGTLRVHPAARLGLKLAGVKSAKELAFLSASVGLASNLAALRALATEGIQRGHMSLHARSVAAAAGAKGDEVEQVAKALTERGPVSLDAARQCLGELRLR